MGKIVAFSGSLSRDSINRKLVELAVGKMEERQVEHINLADYPLPLFSSQTEKELGQPENAQQLYKLFGEADGFVISVPEYNGSMPAGFKNTIDWLSRNPEKVFRGKPVLLMATSPGGRGGATVLSHLETIIPFWGADLKGVFSLPKFGENYSEDSLTQEFQSDFETKLQGFSDSINS